MNSRKGSLELPKHSQSVRSTGDNLDLSLTCEVGRQGLPYRSEPLPCGIWYYLQVDSVRIELNGRTPKLMSKNCFVYGKIHTRIECRVITTNSTSLLCLLSLPVTLQSWPPRDLAKGPAFIIQSKGSVSVHACFQSVLHNISKYIL